MAAANRQLKQVCMISFTIFLFFAVLLVLTLLLVALYTLLAFHWQ